MTTRINSISSLEPLVAFKLATSDFSTNCLTSAAVLPQNYARLTPLWCLDGCTPIFYHLLVTLEGTPTHRSSKYHFTTGSYLLNLGGLSRRRTLLVAPTSQNET